MSDISYGQLGIKNLSIGNLAVASIYEGAGEKLYNGVITITFVYDSNYLTGIKKSTDNVAYTTYTLPKESKIYAMSNSQLNVTNFVGNSYYFYGTTITNTSEYHYFCNGWTYTRNGTTNNVPTTAAGAIELQDGDIINLTGRKQLQYYTLRIQKDVSGANAGIGTIDPSTVSVPYGATVTCTANGTLGSASAKYRIYKTGDGAIDITNTIPVTAIQPGEADYGYFYYSYYWDHSSFTMTGATTITISSSRPGRQYTVEFSAGEGLYFRRSEDDTTTTRVSYTVPARSKLYISSTTGRLTWIDTTYTYVVNRYPDSTPNMYGFDHWSRTTDGDQELGIIMQNNSSSTINVVAYSKVVWVKKNTSVNSYTFTFSHDSQSNSATITGMPALNPSYIYLTMHYTKTGIGATDVTEDYEFYSNETIKLMNRGYILGTITKRSGSSGTLVLDYTFNTYQLSNTNIEITVTGVYGPA